MRGRSLALICFTGASFALGCDRAPVTEGRADDLATAKVIVVTAPDSSVAVVGPAGRAARGEIAGPSAQGVRVGMAPQVDPALTLPDPVATREVTLAPVIGAAGQRGWTAPTMTLFGSAVQPWLVQVGPRMDLGRNSGLMLRGGTQGQHNRWDLGASATVGDRSNVQGVVRFHH